MFQFPRHPAPFDPKKYECNRKLFNENWEIKSMPKGKKIGKTFWKGMNDIVLLQNDAVYVSIKN